MYILYAFTIISTLYTCICFPCFQESRSLEPGSSQYNFIKYNPDLALREHLFKMSTSRFSRKIVELAMKHGANIHREAQTSHAFNQQKSLVDHAIERQDLVALKFLLDHNASLTHRSFLFSCGCGTPEIVTLLLEHNPVLINLVDENHCHPLDFSTFSGNLPVAQLLLKLKPELLGKKNEKVPLPIHTACQHGHNSLIQLFLKYNPSLLYCTDDHGLNLLQIAIAFNHLKTVKLLIEKDSRTTWTSTLEACLKASKFTNIHPFLSKLKASRTAKQQTALETMEAMIKNGATPTLVAQWLARTVPDGAPHTFSLFTQSHADPEKVARLSKMLSSKT